MSQVSYDILGSQNPGTVLKTTIDQFFAATNSMNSGSTEPATKFPFMLWTDTSVTPAVIKQRDSTNANWIVIGYADRAGWQGANAGNPNGVVTGLFQGQSFYDITNNVAYRYSGSGTVWYAQQSSTNALLSLPANYHDVRVEWVSATQIKILAGSRCRSADDTVDIVFTSDYTIDMTNATPTFSQGGRTVAEGASTQYYTYVGLDSSNRPLAWIDTADLSAGGSVTNPAAYNRGRRQLLVNGIQDEQLIVFNNSSSDIDYVGGSLIWLTGGNGTGSTNTRFRRYTTVLRNIGKAATLTQSATLGDSYTINKNGKYAISITDGSTTGSYNVGISLDSNQGTTSIVLIPDLNRLILGSHAVNLIMPMTIERDFVKGNVLRTQTDGNANSTVSAAVVSAITRIG